MDVPVSIEPPPSTGIKPRRAMTSIRASSRFSAYKIRRGKPTTSR